MSSFAARPAAAAAAPAGHGRAGPTVAGAPREVGARPRAQPAPGSAATAWPIASGRAAPEAAAWTALAATSALMRGFKSAFGPPCPTLQGRARCCGARGCAADPLAPARSGCGRAWGVLRASRGPAPRDGVCGLTGSGVPRSPAPRRSLLPPPTAGTRGLGPLELPVPPRWVRGVARPSLGVAQGLGPLGSPGRRLGLRGWVEPVPGGRTRTQRSCPARFSACDLRAPRGSRRPGWLEEETRREAGARGRGG